MADGKFLSNAWNKDIFRDKVVFCTGGSGTICSVQVRALVVLGANACIVGRDASRADRVAREIASSRCDAKVIGIGGVDVRKYESLEEAVGRCIRELGGIDFVIAGAAGNFLASIDQLSPNAFKTVLEIDVLGSYNTLKATIAHLVESAGRHRAKSIEERENGPGGRIIFLSSTTHYIGSPFQTHVAVAKAGVDALSNNVALEYGPKGVTSNVISPGPIEGSEGVDRLIPSSGRDKVRKGQPLGRYGNTRDIADATVYLFADTGSYVSGHTLVVDGASWRAPGGSLGQEIKYPDFLLSGKVVSEVGGSREKKL